MQPYDHKKIEPKWQKIWAKDKAGEAVGPKKSKAANANGSAKKFYALIEFPYPSGDGLHVGHIRSNTAMDIISHKRRREGYDVLYPIGWDAFGLPTENYAIKTGIQPAVVTKNNTDTFRRQLKSLGFFFDWSREINTTDPKYYKWTQWIFQQFLKEGLAYKKKMTVNWCPKDLIVLANEEVIDGRCERCGTLVEKREKEQWMLAITKYADKLLEGLEAVEYDMPKLVDKNNPPEKGVDFVTRHCAHAIVFDPKNKKYLIIRNKKFGWDTLIIGGIEKGETAIDAAVREVREESGYADIEFKRLLGGQTEARYFAKHKNENRIAYAQGVYFELKSDKRVPIADGEDSANEILWIDEADFTPAKMINSELPIWLERIKNPSAGWPKPLLDWPEHIKDSQRNWIGKSEGAEFNFGLSVKNTKTRFVILHGYKGSAKTNFIPWLKSELEKRGHQVEAPELPNPAKPTESEQVEYVLKNCRLDENTVVVGHSLGSIVAMKALMKLNKPISGLVLVAPAHDPSFGEIKVIRPYHENFEWDLDISKIKEFTGGKIAVLTDGRDKDYRVNYGKHIAGELGARLVETSAASEHFCADKEPEILKAVTPSITVFTTRPDTLFGVTYVVLAPENPWIQIMLSQLENKKEIEEYIAKAKNQTDVVRTDAKREKKGVELQGLSAINPATGEKVPVWVADYVLGDYGTGAVMAVPAHDERDFEFAKKYGLPIKQVIENPKGETVLPYTKDGIVINSETYPWANGLLSEDARHEIVDKLEYDGLATPKTTFKLRDWVFSRQRYWGEPIPVVHCDECGVVPVPEKDLPVKLPEVKNYKPTETGESPLAAISDWVNVKCPKCGSKKEKEKYFIFDFDGVLGDTWKAAIKAHLNMDSTSEEAAVKGIMKYFDGKPDHARDMKQAPEQVKKGLDFIKKFGEHVIAAEPQLFKDFIKEVKKYKSAKCAVVSSGSQAYVLPMLEKSGIKFTHILAYEDHASKEEKIEWVCRDWNVGVKDIHYFTDTKADVYELENLVDRTKIIGCAWGFCGFDKLREVLPENQILKDFKDIHKYFKYAGMARRETDTMPNWAGSSWYYLRYTDPKNAKAFAGKDALDYWTPVDWYNGGMEHTTLHLLYSRFWHKFLFDQGLVPTNEPYTKRTSHGLILAKGGEKMSKSKGNVVNPDGTVEVMGADSLRLYEMFMGPFEQAIAWDENGIVGCRRFIERVWKLAEKVAGPAKKGTEPASVPVNSEIEALINKTIKKVTEDIETMRFNTAVSALMIAVNELEKQPAISQENYSAILLLLAPFAPHVTEELWDALGNRESIHQALWPAFNPSRLTSLAVKIAVQINGKTRAIFEMPAEEANQMDEQGAREKAATLDEIKKWIYGKEIKKVIYVKGRLINVVLTVQ